MNHDAWDIGYLERPCSALRLCSEAAIRSTDHHPERCVKALFAQPAKRGGKRFEGGAQHCAERALWYQLDNTVGGMEPYGNALSLVATAYPRRCGELAHNVSDRACVYPYASYLAGHLKPPVTRVANASLVPIDRAMARNCTRAWRRVAAHVPCGDRCKWMLANFAGIGWEGALRRIAVEYKQKCGALARPECATVLADERKKIRIGAGVGSSGK